MTMLDMLPEMKVCDFCLRSDTDDIMERGLNGKRIPMWEMPDGCIACAECLRKEHPESEWPQELRRREMP